MGTLRAVGRALEDVAEGLRARRRLLVVLTLVTWVVLLVLGPDYAQLQTADDAHAFRDTLGDDKGRYVAAAIADLFFAAAYGIGAISITIRRRWSVAGGLLVLLGAVADEIENVIVLRNISRESSVGDGSIDLMTTAGAIKYSLIGLGLAVLFAAYVWSRRDALLSWLRTKRLWARWLTLIALLLSLVPAAGAGPSWVRWPLLIGLLAALTAIAVKLNAIVRDDRANADHVVARVLLATLQLAVGVLFVSTGDRLEGDLADVLFFLGIVFFVLALGAFVSELRQVQFFTAPRCAVLLAIALVAFVAAAVAGTDKAVPLIVAGIVVGELGTELLSERYHRATNAPFPDWVVGLVGLVVLLLGLALFVGAGADPAHALPVIAVLAVVVFMASADGDALIIVILVAIALVWASSPTESEIPDARVPVAGADYFVVLGDSYISGEGATEFIAGTNEKIQDPDPNAFHTNECRRALTAWPFLVAEMAEQVGSTNIPSRVLFLACSGAVTENIHTEPRRDTDGDQHGPAELALLEEAIAKLGRPPAFAVISIGGNDAGFGEIGQTCVGPGNCAEVAEQFLRSEARRDLPDQRVDGLPRMGIPEALQWIGDDLDAAYKRLIESMRGNPVIAIPYPIPLTETGECRGVLLDDHERRFIRGFVPELNDVIRNAAAANGVALMDDMEDALIGTGSQLCSTLGGGAGLNFLALNPTSGALADTLDPRNWIHNSLHPNADGHRAMAREAFDWLSTNLPSLPATEGDPDGISTVDQVLGGAPVPQCVPRERPSCAVDGGVWLGEQLQVAYGNALFPLAVAVAGLWLCLNALLRAAQRQDPPITADWLLSRHGVGTLRAQLARAARWLWRR